MLQTCRMLQKIVRGPNEKKQSKVKEDGNRALSLVACRARISLRSNWDVEVDTAKVKEDGNRAILCLFCLRLQ